MKKNLPYLIISFFAFILILFFACRKELSRTEELNFSNNPDINLDVSQARAYFKIFEARESKDTKTSISTSSSKRVGKKIPIFNKAYTSQTNKSSFVETPLFYNRRTSSIIKHGKSSNKEDDIEIFKATVEKLLIYKSKKTGRIHQKIISYIPDISYLRKHNNDISHNKINKLDNDFTGYIEYKKWDGTPLYYIRVWNGKAIQKIIALKKKNSKPKSTPKVLELYICDEFTIFEYQYGCWTNDEGQEECGDVEILNSWDITVYCDDGGDQIPIDYCLEYGICDEDLTGDDCYDWGINCDEPDPTPEPDESEGNKPEEFADKCSGILGLWNKSLTNNNREVVGFITSNGKIILTQIQGPNGGDVNGLVKSGGTVYYGYSDSYGAPIQTYPGMLHQNGKYYIPISATIHTHSPCLTDNTNGVSQLVSNEDSDLAAELTTISHYIIGCDALGSYDEDSSEYDLIESGNLADICDEI